MVNSKDHSYKATESLDLRTLRVKNVQRLADAFPQCRDWTIADWSNAMNGEAGEAANLVKKIRRGDYVDIAAVEKELADMICYADLLAYHLDIDLGKAVRQKFNEVSKRVGSQVFLSEGSSEEVMAHNKSSDDKAPKGKPLEELQASENPEVRELAEKARAALKYTSVERTQDIIRRIDRIESEMLEEKQ